ncbi:MAG: hypothetical protein JRC91_04600 [Deltaproteobacteria bacterium]|nr:hypothetical protein [Deltaproteobacteria bacterium]
MDTIVYIFGHFRGWIQRDTFMKNMVSAYQRKELVSNGAPSLLNNGLIGQLMKSPMVNIPFSLNKLDNTVKKEEIINRLKIDLKLD